jgi:hypothetical protein
MVHLNSDLFHTTCPIDCGSSAVHAQILGSTPSIHIITDDLLGMCAILADCSAFLMLRFAANKIVNRKLQFPQKPIAPTTAADHDPHCSSVSITKKCECVSKRERMYVILAIVKSPPLTHSGLKDALTSAGRQQTLTGNQQKGNSERADVNRLWIRWGE